jgi:hypothetical protein
MRVDAHTIAVERMRLGDHAFAHYADDNVRWEVPAVFTYRGLSRGEKVIVMMDPATSADDACARLAAYGGGADAARASGQLEFSSMRELISPGRVFTAGRQLDRLREEIELAGRQGFEGLRTVIDMAWVQDMDMDVEAVMEREKNAASLFESGRYAESARTTGGRSIPGWSRRCGSATRSPCSSVRATCRPTTRRASSI